MQKQDSPYECGGLGAQVICINRIGTLQTLATSNLTINRLYGSLLSFSGASIWGIQLGVDQYERKSPLFLSTHIREITNEICRGVATITLSVIRSN